MESKTKTEPQTISVPNPPAPVRPTKPMKHVTESVDQTNLEKRDKKN